MKHSYPSLFSRFALWMTAPALALSAIVLPAQSWKYLTEVPDYTWHAGCFGTANGNIMGFWDRHGLPSFYDGPTGGGVAPLNSLGANESIRSLWTSQAGLDGRPAGSPGHIEDYYVAYESTAADPYISLGRQEHTPDCIGDFIGLNQNKWTNLADECRGNIDGYSFVFWDKRGARRTNFSYTNAISGQHIPDIQSGLKAWAKYRGYDADVFTQLTSFNPERTVTTSGFTYNDVKAEINAGYPVLCFLQPANQFSRNFSGAPGVNPAIHGVLIYGYVDDVAEIGVNDGVVIRTSWGSGDNVMMEWNSSNWLGLFPVRGVIGFRPKPKITSVQRSGNNLTVSWDGPSAQLYDNIAGSTTTVHRYQLERATSLTLQDYTPVGSLTTERTVTVSESFSGPAFFRVRLTP